MLLAFIICNRNNFMKYGKYLCQCFQISAKYYAIFFTLTFGQFFVLETLHSFTVALRIVSSLCNLVVKYLKILLIWVCCH